MKNPCEKHKRSTMTGDLTCPACIEGETAATKDAGPPAGFVGSLDVRFKHGEGSILIDAFEYKFECLFGTTWSLTMPAVGSGKQKVERFRGTNPAAAIKAAIKFALNHYFREIAK